MPASLARSAAQPAAIIGREAGLARLRELVDPVPQASQVLLVIGEAGMGKTVLLAEYPQGDWCQPPAPVRGGSGNPPTFPRRLPGGPRC